MNRRDIVVDCIIAVTAIVLGTVVVIIGGIEHPTTYAGAVARWFFAL